MSIAHKSLSLFSRDILFSIIGLTINVTVARTLGPVGLGVWVILDLLNNYGRVLGGPRLEISSVYFLGQKKYDRGEVMFMCNIVALFFSFLLTGLAFWQIDLIRKVFFHSTVVDPLALILVLCHFPLLFLKRNYHYFLLSREDTTSFNTMMVLQEIVNPGLTITLLMVFKMGVTALAVGMLGGSLASLIFGAIRLHKHEKLTYRFDLKLLKEMLTFSSKTYLAEASGFLNIYLSNIINATLLPAAALTYFSMGKGRAEWLNRITNAVSTILYPHVSNLTGSGQDAVTVTNNALRLVFLILIACGALMAAVIYPATLILYGRDFLPVVPVFLIILPSLLFFSLSNLKRQFFMGIGKANIPLLISITPLLLQTGLCYLFTRRFGYLGAAAGVSATFLFTSFLTFVFYCHYSKSSIRDLLIPHRGDFKLIYRLVRNYVVMFWGKLKQMVTRKAKPTPQTQIS